MVFFANYSNQLEFFVLLFPFVWMFLVHFGWWCSFELLAQGRFS